MASTEDPLKAARDKHYEAHMNWEWWTASNGASFHNPDQATESLNKSMSDVAGGHQDPGRRDEVEAGCQMKLGICRDRGFSGAAADGRRGHR